MCYFFWASKAIIFSSSAISINPAGNRKDYGKITLMAFAEAALNSDWLQHKAALHAFNFLL